MLGATWKLVYTQSPLSSLLALGRLPFVTVGDITQTIDPATGTIVNKVPLAHRLNYLKYRSGVKAGVCDTAIAISMISARYRSEQVGKLLVTCPDGMMS